MSRDKQNIKTTDWLTRGMTEAEIAKVKEEAIAEADAELRDKQIEEMVMVLTESQHAFDRAWKECLHNNAPMPDRENVFYAKYLVEKEGYRKASEVAREVIADMRKY